MKKYDSYKDSGIDWIGEIPSHWEVKRFKRLAKIFNGQDHKEVWDDNGEFPVIGSGGVFGRANKYLFEGPSILLGRKGTIDKPQFITEPFWSVDTAYYTKIDENVNPKLFFYICTTIDFDHYKYGSAVPSMTQETLNQILFVISKDLDEQTAIANFLDLKTAEIDEIIADKKRLLELYEEEKTAIINKAVTKGINPDASMKDSGIEWLGEIPEHWEVKRLKYVAKIGNGKDHKNVWDEDGVYPIYGSGGIFGKSNEFIYDKPSVLLGRKGTIDKPQFVEVPFWAVDTTYYTIINEDLVLPYYFFLLTNTIDFNKYKYGSAVPSMTQEVLKEILFAVPSLLEQEVIVHHIESECSKIDFKKARTEELIELLTEYRRALISEAVTGKIKVTENCENNKGASQYHQDH